MQLDDADDIATSLLVCCGNLLLFARTRKCLIRIDGRFRIGVSAAKKRNFEQSFERLPTAPLDSLSFKVVPVTESAIARVRDSSDETD